MWFSWKNRQLLRQAVIDFFKKIETMDLSLSLSIYIYISENQFFMTSIMSLKNRDDNRRGFVPVYDYHTALAITKVLNDIMDTNLFTVQS
jgi:hypothetical protein